ncbi:MAG: cytochrome P450, partial [Acidimicrobiales bacterium]
MANPTVDEFDPGELQGGLLMQVENLHERLREARARHRVMVGNPFGEAASQTLGSAGVTALGYDECQTVLTHPDTFSSSIYDQIMGPVMGRTLLELEGAEHRASRALVSPSFRSALLERWRSELVQVVVHELIDGFAPRGHAELVREFTFAFPVQVIARMMGLPREDYPRFQRLSIELLNVVYDWDCGIAASAALKAYFNEVLAERRRDPRDDLISTLAESEIDGARLRDDEIFAFLLLILPAGVETTYRASGNLLVGLLTDPA